MRMQDKLARYVSIKKKSIQLVENESLRDTLIDLHNYAAMAILLLDEE
jgi:DNA-binding XRE family transcriptional regulator